MHCPHLTLLEIYLIERRKKKKKVITHSNYTKYKDKQI